MVASEERMKSLLADADYAVTGERMMDYGTPKVNYQRIAELWNDYLNPPDPLTPIDVAILMILTKVARLMESPEHYDTWKDIAGYAAVGWALTGEPSND